MSLEDLREWHRENREKTGCEHCMAMVSHFHPDGSGLWFGGPSGAGYVISAYYLGWAPLTDHDADLPGAEYAQHLAKEATR